VGWGVGSFFPVAGRHLLEAARIRSVDFLVVIKGGPEAVGERGARAPAGGGVELGGIHPQARHVPGSLGRKGHGEVGAAGGGEHEAAEFANANLLAVAEVDEIADEGVGFGDLQQGVGAVLDKKKIAGVGAVAEDHGGVAGERAEHEARDDLAGVALEVGARTIVIEGADADDGQAVALVVGGGVVLAGELGPTVDGGGPGGGGLGEGEGNRLAVDFARRDVDETLGAGLPGRGEQVERTEGVDLMVTERVVQRCTNTETGEVEDYVLSSHGVLAGGGVRDITANDLDATSGESVD